MRSAPQKAEKISPKEETRLESSLTLETKPVALDGGGLPTPCFPPKSLSHTIEL